ncbi:hypothetical protein [Desulfocurvus sp. DL9XJH121]
MLIYNYDADSGEYLGEGTARPDPLETARGGQPAYLIPANATAGAPPEAVAGYARCFVDGAWTQVEDHRGETYYGTATGQAVTIAELGALPDGITQDAPGTHQIWDEDSATWVEDQAVMDAAALAAMDAQLAALDLAAVRALRAVQAAGLAGETPDAGDVSTLAGLETRAVALRAQRAELAAQA